MADESGKPNQRPSAGGDLQESQPSNTTTDTNQKQAVEHLTQALGAEERSEKEFHIRQALQFLNIEER